MLAREVYLTGSEAIGVAKAFAESIAAQFDDPEGKEGGVTLEQLHEMLNNRVTILTAENLAEAQGRSLGLLPIAKGQQGRKTGE